MKNSDKRMDGILNPEILFALKQKIGKPLLPKLMSEIPETSNLDAFDFIAMFDDESVDLIGTDEPFGAASTRLNLKARTDITSDFKWDGDYPSHLTIPWVYNAARVLNGGGVLWNCGFPDFSTTFRAVCEDAGLTWRVHKAWFKTNCAPHFRRNNWVSSYEIIWIASKGSWKGRFAFQEQRAMQNWVMETTCTFCGTQYPVYLSNKFDHPKWFAGVKFEQIDPGSIPSFIGTPMTDSLCPGCDNVHPVFLSAQAVFDNKFMAEYVSPITKAGGVRHPTKKPVWLAMELLSVLGGSGDVFLDPFSGQGTFPIEAKRVGMEAYANDFADDGEEEWYKYTKIAMEQVQVQERKEHEENMPQLQESIWNE